MWKLAVILGLHCAALLFQEAHCMVRDETAKKSPADLRRDIFKNYDPKVIPVKTPGESVYTKTGITPIFLRELNEEKEIIVLDAWIYMGWTDDFLKWDPNAYDGIERLNLPSAEVWKPDITAYTATPDTKLMPQVPTNIIVNYTGDVTWVPPLTISSRCALDLSQYPDDIQMCKIKLGSWTYSNSLINLQLTAPTVDLSYFSDNNQRWSLLSATVERRDNYYPCCPGEDYPSINYNITLRRKLAPDVHISDTVSYFAVFLGLLMFWMPPDSTHKILLGALAEILLGLASLYLGAVLQAPIARIKAAERVFTFMYIVAGSLLFEVLIMNLARIMGPCRPPRCLVAIAKGCCQPFCVCVSRPYPGGDLRNEVVHSEKSKKHVASAQEEWNIVAMAFDRILFFFALITSVFCFYIYK